MHHKTYIDSENINDPTVTLNHSNLEYLCQTCHNREHHEQHSPVRYGMAFDNDGNLINLEG